MIRYDYDPLINQPEAAGLETYHLHVVFRWPCGLAMRAGHELYCTVLYCLQVYSGLSCGLAMSCLTTIFLPVSGAHINPAVSVSAATIQVSCHQYSPLIGQTALNTDL